MWRTLEAKFPKSFGLPFAAVGILGAVSGIAVQSAGLSVDWRVYPQSQKPT